MERVEALETFLYVCERFVSAANHKLLFGDLEKFENFEDVLQVILFPPMQM